MPAMTDFWPDFMIIGAQKAGTSSLFYYLAQQPGLVPAQRKEIHYFNYPYHYRKGPEWYRSHFQRQISGLHFEASPNYFNHPEAVPRLAHDVPQVKLLVLLREPVSRAYAAWNMFHHDFADPAHRYHRLWDPRSFAEAIAEEWELENTGPAASPQLNKAYLQTGHYARHLKHLLAYFAPEQILPLDFAALQTTPKQVVQRCLDFLGTKSTANPQSVYPILNAGQYRTPLDPKLAAQLRAYFRPHLLELAALQPVWPQSEWLSPFTSLPSG